MKPFLGENIIENDSNLNGLGMTSEQKKTKEKPR